MKGGLLSAVLGIWLLAACGAAAQSATFAHDANGNLVARREGGVEWVYAYDSRDQLREVRRDGIIVEVYQYDAEGRRIRKTSSDGVFRYVWDDKRIVEETDDFGNSIAKYRYAGDRIVSVEHVTEGHAFYVLDDLGTPSAVVRADGTVAARYRIDSWGVLRAEDGTFPNPFRFTGHQFDEATGLYYAKARYYDPATGRFLTKDPFEGEPHEPTSQHRYLYGYANPTVYLDPDGRCVGSLQRTEFCQAIATKLAFAIDGNPEVDVEREIERRLKVVEGRREFRRLAGREPLPHEVVWSEGTRAITSGFDEIDTSGRIEADHAESVVVGAAMGARAAVGATRLAGGGAAQQVVSAGSHLGDEFVGELTGLSPGDVAGVSRLAREATEASPPQAMIVAERNDLRVQLVPLQPRPRPQAGREGRQERLHQIASDPLASAADRGWIRQDINEVALGKRRHVRNPPGKVLAHERGREAAKGYSYQYSNLQDQDLHRLQHRYDDFGRRNKERPPEKEQDDR